MMSEAEQYAAVQWFVAGYLYALTRDADQPIDNRQAAYRAAGTHVQRHRRGACLDCGREGIVLLDGLYCERCFDSPRRMLPDCFDDRTDGDK